MARATKSESWRSTYRRGLTSSKGWSTYPDTLHLSIERFKGVVVENRPAIALMKECDGIDTLHYVDPPYLPSTRDAGTDYRHEMTEADHVALAEVLHELKGAVVLSGYPSALYDKLFDGWEVDERQARAVTGAKRTERIWIKRASARRKTRRTAIAV